MGNKRDEMENEGNAEVGVGIGLLGLLVGGAVMLANNSKKKREEAEQQQLRSSQTQKQLAQINAQINDIDNQIDYYRNQLFGKFTYSTEINELQNKRAQLVKLRNQLL